MLECCLQSSQELGEVPRNIGSILLKNARELTSQPAFAERRHGQYRYWTWQELLSDAFRVTAFFQTQGLRPGDKIGFVTGNGYWRFVSELACLSFGAVSVPIFPGYPAATVRELLKFADVQFLLADSEALVSGLKGDCAFGAQLIGASEWPLSSVGESELRQIENIFSEVSPTSLAMIMFTSGTSGKPKGVMLTHANILSQQKALELLWKPKAGLRFLCYLPWHHSFGGLFERFFAVCSGGTLAVDDSCGKDVGRLLENFDEIKPNVYFSVPKVYQEIVTRVLSSPRVERSFFHPELQFIFTAAAPLPHSTSEVFKAKGVPIVEGWGLTETSPCCTLTELSLEREPGVVGWAIPGVQICLDESGEILVRGPNVMRGYYNSPALTREVLDEEGWFHTGDLGELTAHGVKILSRKDRMFKLNNGEKVFPAGIEERVKARCRYIKHAYVFGRGQSRASILVFPNNELLGTKTSSALADATCAQPCTEAAFCDCLGRCVTEINASIQSDIERLDRVVIVPSELTIENCELTPSFKLVPGVIEERYQKYMLDQPPADALTFNLRVK